MGLLMDNNSADTVALLERVRAGDREALNDIFARYRERLRRMVDLRLDPRLHARIDASDVIQDAYVALVDALTAHRDAIGPASDVVRGSVAAVSVGLCDGAELLDLDYAEDKDADVDLNLVMTGGGDIIEVQAGGEEATFSLEQLGRLLELGKRGIDAILRGQREALGADWPLD